MSEERSTPAAAPELDSAASSSPAPRRRRRIVRRLGRVLLAFSITFIVFALAAWFLVVPEVARMQIDGLLRQYEPGRREFTLQSIGPSRMTLTNVRLGQEPWLRADCIEVRYRVLDLLAGRVGGIVVSEFQWRVRTGSAGIDWGFTIPPRTAGGDDEMPFEAFALREGRLLLDAGGREITVPFASSGAVDAAGTLRGEVRSQPVSLVGHDVDGFDAAFAFDGLRLDADADWPLIAGPPLRASLDFDFSAAASAGSVHIHQPQFDVDAAPFIATLWPALGEFESAGRIAVDARFTLLSGRLQPHLTVKAEDLALADHDWPIAIAAASGTIAFDSLSPLSTEGPQRLRIDSATSGEIDITSAQLELDLAETGMLQVFSARWFMSDGGRYEASPLTIDLNQPRIATTISCENVDLNFWLELMAGRRADGQGRLAGEFAIDWNPRAQPRLQFSSGALTAVPATGYLRIHDAPALSELIDEADPRFTLDKRLQLVKERIIAALQDLGYTSLRLGFIPDGRDTTLRAEIQGKGRRGERPQEFSGLVMNISHFGQSLQTVLNTVSAPQRMSELRLRPRTPRVPHVGAPQGQESAP